MSRALLAQRLPQLEDAGIIQHAQESGSGRDYAVTRAGEELRPVIEHLGGWGQRSAQFD